MKEITLNDLKTNFLKWTKYVEAQKILGITKYGRLKLIIKLAPGISTNSTTSIANSKYEFKPIFLGQKKDFNSQDILKKFLNDRED